METKRDKEKKLNERVRTQYIEPHKTELSTPIPEPENFDNDNEYSKAISWVINNSIWLNEEFKKKTPFIPLEKYKGVNSSILIKWILSLSEMEGASLTESGIQCCKHVN